MKTLLHVLLLFIFGFLLHRIWLIVAEPPQAPEPEPILEIEVSLLDSKALDASTDAGTDAGPDEPGVPLRTSLLRGYYLRSEEATYQAFRTRLHEYTRIRDLNFMGSRFLANEALQEPLHCVEQHILEHCHDEYQIHTLSGWRPENTYVKHPKPRLQEYSNHIFGIALDIDSERNPCCGCLKKWRDNPRCLPENGAITPDGGTPIGAYELPACWIAAFKRYGFHWLGDDLGLRDTMHFEFLAEPGSVSCP